MPGQTELRPEERTLVESAIRHFENKRYDLFAWVVMNDHCHALVQPYTDWRLEHILHSWKSYTANQMQRQFGRLRCLWQDETFDRIVRDANEFDEKLIYILNNPLKRWPGLESYEWLGAHSEFNHLLPSRGGHGGPPH